MFPLDGIRVLDVTQVMAGPFACMLLGDMGADVIKVEPPPTGDSTRRAMGFRLKGEDSPGFLALNRNKRSIALNLKDTADREVFYALVKTADVLVENARPGVADRLGMSYDLLREINPRLVYTSISGFGTSGPWADRPGFDLIAQAMTGVISATGLPGQEPVKNGVPVCDLGAAMFAVYGILGALMAREKTGSGQLVTTSLFEAGLGLSIWEATEFWGTGKPPKPLGTANRMAAPYQAVRASDQYFVLGAANDRLWKRFLTVVNREDLSEDPRFATNSGRTQNLAPLIEELQATFSTKTAAEWVELLIEAGVPAGPILDHEEVLASEHTAARDMVLDIPHPVEGTFKSLGFPVKLSETPQQVRRPPPLFDEHSEEIRQELVDRGLLTPTPP